jgi:hypothetical protein
MKSASLAALILLIASLASAGGPDKEPYRPYPHPYPQIIQASDYPTIDAIEALFRDLKKSGDDEMSCETGATTITLKRRNDANLGVLISVPEKGPASVGEQHYLARETIVLLTTLKRILTDLSKTTSCSRVRFDQFGARAYKKRTIIEFDFGAAIVLVDSFSNGPHDGERLYVLDIIDRKDSYFWGR